MLIGLAVLMLGGLAAYAVLNKWWLVAGSSGLLLVAVFSLTFMWVPIIQANAEEVAAGRPYCLSIPSRHRPVQSRLELTPFSAKGSRLSPHLMLWVDEGESIEPYMWSYRRQSFRQHLPGGVMRNCRPRADFLATLTPEAPGMHVTLGQDDYVIPPEYAPGHADDNVIYLRFWREGAADTPGSMVEWGEHDILRWQRMDADSRTTTPIASASVRADGDYGFSIRDFDQDGTLVQKFSCNIYDSCRLEFLSGQFLFDVFLPPTDAADVAEVRTKIEELWDSFRQDD